MAHLSMRFGAAVPQKATAGDPVAVRDFAQGIEALGFAFLATFDHVLGASPATYPALPGSNDREKPFWEPLVLFGYLAGQTRVLELVSNVMVLPQRQTALVAKQAATADLLSGGRLRLGVGTGWNWVEFEALGESFRNRGRRSEEQIALLRELWTQDFVTFRGQWHTVTDAGISPLPVQRPIPLWIGGGAEAVADRVGRIGDGWIVVPQGPAEEYRMYVERIHTVARAAGRDPGTVGLEAWVSLGGRAEDQWVADAEGWHALGATHLTVNTEYALGMHQPSDATTVDEHLRVLERYRDVVGGFA